MYLSVLDSYNTQLEKEEVAALEDAAIPEARVTEQFLGHRV